MGLEREQAERDQQRALAADDWIMESSQLGDGIDPQAFSMIG